jgi:aryl-alcohol dehydrogenase-like predicted oxidoreductase
MEYKRLGSTDLKISRVGFGCWAIGGHGWGMVDDNNSIAAIRKALDLGVNFFDTADVYGFGHSETVLGKALGADRKKVVIATKFGLKWDQSGKIRRDTSAKRVKEAVNGSLKRLGVECIALYQIHWPDGKTPIAETMEALRRCQEDGKIRHIGCSNVPVSLVKEAQKILRIESLQIPYSIGTRGDEKKLGPLCQKHKISMLAHSTLMQGLLTGKYSRDSRFEKDDIRNRYADWVGDHLRANLRIVERLQKLATSYKKSLAQMAIRWVLDNPRIACALTGIKRPEQIEQNADVFGWKLSRKDREYVSGL